MPWISPWICYDLWCSYKPWRTCNVFFALNPKIWLGISLQSSQVIKERSVFWNVFYCDIIYHAFFVFDFFSDSVEFAWSLNLVIPFSLCQSPLKPPKSALIVQYGSLFKFLISFSLSQSLQVSGSGPCLQKVWHYIYSLMRASHWALLSSQPQPCTRQPIKACHN